jgi:hypothetical protein
VRTPIKTVQFSLTVETNTQLIAKTGFGYPDMHTRNMLKKKNEKNGGRVSSW